jgi:endonuclease YncB( thermonuclease family)
MSKHWKPQTVPLKPSRIRRDPVRLAPAPPPRRELSHAAVREREIRSGIAGVLLVTAALIAAIVGISWATFSRDDPAADARAHRFGQCYNSSGLNCVIDGGTIQVRGQRIAIAGIEAPRIQGARCDAERDRGIDAAVQLAELLNRGQVTVARAAPGSFGTAARKVEVNGSDVGEAMIARGLARPDLGEPTDWCG